jgi:hypothetical protein
MKVIREVVIILVVIGAAFGGLVYLFNATAQVGPSREYCEGRAVQALKAFASAQGTYRSMSLASTGKSTYWRKDIAGLSSAKGTDGKDIGALRIGVARADVKPAVPLDPHPTPHFGYYFVALPFRGEPPFSPDRFAAVAFPYPSSKCDWMFVISESGIIYRKKCTDRKPPPVFPDDPLKEGWDLAP